MAWGGLDVLTFERASQLVQHVYFWIFVLGVPLVIWIIKYWRSRAIPRTLLSYVRSKYGAGSVLDRQLLKRLSCVVVDDKPEDFPVEFMRGFFGSVVIETMVSLNDARRLSDFDVIFLDVADVVSEDPRRGGALLIDRIRQYRKDNIVVSVSSKKYDVEVTRYFEAADIRIRKPLVADAIEDQFIAHFANKAGPEAIAVEIDKAVLRVGGARKVRRIVKQVENAQCSGQQVPRSIQLAGVEDEFARLLRAMSKLNEH